MRNWFRNRGQEKVKIFTTRPDTIFGATLAVSVDHPICKNFSNKDNFLKFKNKASQVELPKKL